MFDNFFCKSLQTGAGFYCGENLEQSAMFVSTFSESSLYMLRYNPTDLNGKTYGVNREWMLMIAYFRERLGEYSNSGIMSNLIAQLQGVDYIIAPIAEKEYYLSSRQESYEINRDKVKVARKQYRNQGQYIEDILKEKNG